ncbi:DUF4136 domain-containing protein [Thalassospira marina]|nr:DUF4136 domain-containing protein [Thalassospira marina]
MAVKRPKWLVVLAGLLVAGCASGPLVHTDQNPATDFGAYHSYAFVEAAGKDREAQYTTLTGQRMEDRIAAQMQGHGYSLDIHHPDLLVDYHIAMRDQQVVRPGPSYGGYYGSHGRGGIGVGVPLFGDSGQVETYVRGEVVIDLIDRRTNKTVWEGKTGHWLGSDGEYYPDSAIAEAIAAIFAKYPYVAGQSAPVMPVNDAQ